MVRKMHSARASRDTGRHGFTLLEILVALTVMTVASYIAISLFAASLDLTQTGRNTTVALRLAEERVADIRINPEIYQYDPGVVSPEGFAEVRARTGDAGSFDAPAALPPDPRGGLVTESLYDQYAWRVYVRPPSADAAFAELVTVVTWTHGGTDRLVTLSSAVPVSLLEGMS